MIEFVRGIVAELTPTCVVLDVGGIGYILQISAGTFSALQGRDEAQLWAHQVLREDSNTLFGFVSQEERVLFRHLITVSGVGPSTARMILSAYSVPELVGAIQTADEALLRQIKGIGSKTAQRIIVDLQGRMVEMGVEQIAVGPAQPSAQVEALSALQALGFARSPSEKVLQHLVKTNPGASVEQLIKMALKQL